MAQKYDLHHWDNSYVKNVAVLILCILKNEIYLVSDGKYPVATFQISEQGSSLYFQKLATDPQYTGKGIGSFCIETIERIAGNRKLNRVACEVYDKSLHAMEFYEHKGYRQYGTVDTLKYTEIQMEKEL